MTTFCDLVKQPVSRPIRNSTRSASSQYGTGWVRQQCQSDKTYMQYGRIIGRITGQSSMTTKLFTEKTHSA